MPVDAPVSSVLRFAAFEVDLRTGELRKHGVRIKLQDQPFKILAMLLEHPGALVTREDIQHALWPAHTFVDFEHSVNAAVRRLRDALNDSADTPRFIETLPRRGYRFLADVSPVEPATEVSDPPLSHTSPLRESELQEHSTVMGGTSLVFRWPVAFLVVALITLFFSWPPPLNPGIDSIAVLPFANETNDPDLDYLAVGVPSRIIDSLSAVDGLELRARNSSFTFRDVPIDTRKAATALNVRALLVGSIRRNGNQLHISAELVDARDEKHLWGHDYSVSDSQLAFIDATIAREVAARLHHVFPASKKRSTSPLAYEAYLRGEYVMDNRTNTNLRMALEYFQKAIDADPDFAQAYASMGKAYGLLGWYGGMPSAEAQRMAEINANRAIELDRDIALAWMVKAACLQNYHHDWVAAQQAGERALALNPNSADINHYYAVGLWRRGRMDEAMAAAARAAELDPLWIGYTANRLAIDYYARRLDHALRLREQNQALRDPQFNLTFALIFAVTGHNREAVAELGALKLETSPPDQLCGIAQVYAMAGDPAQGTEVLALGLRKQALEGATTRSCSSYDAAAAYGALGQTDKMLQSLAIAEQDDDPKLLGIFVDPAFDHYRSDPALQALLVRLKTPR